MFRAILCGGRSGIISSACQKIVPRWTRTTGKLALFCAVKTTRIVSIRRTPQGWMQCGNGTAFTTSISWHRCLMPKTWMSLTLRILFMLAASMKQYVTRRITLTSTIPCMGTATLLMTIVAACGHPLCLGLIMASLWWCAPSRMISSLCCQR